MKFSRAKIFMGWVYYLSRVLFVTVVAARVFLNFFSKSISASKSIENCNLSVAVFLALLVVFSSPAKIC